MRLPAVSYDGLDEIVLYAEVDGHEIPFWRIAIRDRRARR